MLYLLAAIGALDLACRLLRWAPRLIIKSARFAPNKYKTFLGRLGFKTAHRLRKPLDRLRW